MMPGAALLVALLSQTPIVPGTGPASAVTKLRLDVRAPGDCTSRGDLATRIASRSPRIEVVDDAPLSAQVTVSSTRAGGVVADLVLESRGTLSTPRKVVARSCAEAADGAALIIAVTLDPSLRRERASVPAREGTPIADGRAPSPPVPPSTSPTSSVGNESAGGAASRSNVRPEGPPAAVETPALPAVVQSEAKPPRAPSAGGGHELSATLAGQTIFGAAPGVLPGVALYAMAALDRQGAWAPAVFFGAMQVWRSDLSEKGGLASFTLDAASLDLCPVRLGWTRFAARPCASALLGRMAAQGSGSPQTATTARPFGAAGAALGATFGSRFQLSARIGVGVTLLRDSYEFSNNVFFRAAPLTISASLGLGVGWR